MSIDGTELLYLTCGDCEEELPEDESIRNFARLAVAVTPKGDLLVACERHKIGLALFKNDEIGEHLRQIAGYKEVLH